MPKINHRYCGRCQLMSDCVPRAEAARRRHREMLIICTIVVVLSVILQVPSDHAVTVYGMPRIPLPQTCMSRAWFGIDCPGCGLTRSFICLAHGDWQRAWQFHRLGWLLALAVLLQFPYRLYALRRNEMAPLGHRFPKYFGYLLIALLIGNWLSRFL
jgi:hypothetical protein